MTRDQLLSNLRAMRKDAAKAVNLALAEQVGYLIAEADMDHDEATTFARRIPNPHHARTIVWADTIDAAIIALGKAKR